MYRFGLNSNIFQILEIIGLKNMFKFSLGGKMPRLGRNFSGTLGRGKGTWQRRLGEKDKGREKRKREGER